MGPNFQRLTPDVKINPEEELIIPKGATHVGVYAGKVAFFKSNYPTDYLPLGKKKRKFFKIPEGAKICKFPHFKFTPSGYHYGLPEFKFSLPSKKGVQIVPRFHPSPYSDGR